MSGGCRCYFDDYVENEQMVPRYTINADLRSVHENTNVQIGLHTSTENRNAEFSSCK